MASQGFRLFILLSLSLILLGAISSSVALGIPGVPAPRNSSPNQTERIVVTWDDAYRCVEHGLNGTILITELYGKNNLTPKYDLRRGPSDWLYPDLLPAGLSAYKITHDERYLDYARSAADAMEQHMLNDKNIVRMHSFRNGSRDTVPTQINFHALPHVAELAIYDPAYAPLAQRVADGLVRYGISRNKIPYKTIFPNGTAADTTNGISSNDYTISISVIGLLRTYQATGNTTFLNESRNILTSIWTHKRTRFNLIPTRFDSDTLKTVNSDTQLYGTAELLRAYIYYYYLTHDPEIQKIISVYSEAAYRSYWGTTLDGKGYFVYRVNADTGEPQNNLLETNWHKLDMSLIYAGEIAGRRYTDRVFQDMRTYWLDRGLVYRNHLFRHGTKPDGCPSRNAQSLIYASLRTSIYVMLRMLNQGAFNPTAAQWNYAVWEHVNATRAAHCHEYGYNSDVDVETLQPDADYYGLSIDAECGEFASLVTMIFQTTPNVRMTWERFPLGDSALEPFTSGYSGDEVGFMRGVFMDFSHKEVAFKNVTSKGEGRIRCTHGIKEVWRDGQIYSGWHNNTIDVSDGDHEYAIVFEGGSYTPPVYA
jgi:hypothetical protein